MPPPTPHHPARHPARRRPRGLAATGAALALAAGTLAASASTASASTPAASTASASTAAAAPAAAPTTTPGTAAGAPGVLANLWEWNWPSVARECTTVLGPSGYRGVQVAPPADSLQRDASTSDTGGAGGVVHPWWEVYQPVDYQLTSRMGTERQFRDMVTACRGAGVRVYVDAVINHMTGQGTRSYTGARYQHTSYPTARGAVPGSLYGPADFHRRGTGVTECPSSTGGIEDYNDYRQVTKCELLGLADLRTDAPATRAKVVAYLNRLVDLGVSGFRVDAAKHIGEEDLTAIRDQLHATKDGERPYLALEVFPGGPGALSQEAFMQVGSVLGFDYAYQVKNAFKSYPTGATGNITSLRTFGEAAGLVPGDRSLVFIENHDTERGSDTLSYKDGATNLIANEFMLAHPYGTPQVYSAFAFTNSYDSPPATAKGYVTDTNCADAARWVCVDRDPGVRAMVAFHNAVGDAPLRNWYDDGVNLIAFSRGSRGFFSTNNATTPKTVTVQTGLRKGTYCDATSGGVAGGACAGTTVVVDRHGRATIAVGAKDSVAFTVGDRLR